MLGCSCLGVCLVKSPAGSMLYRLVDFTGEVFGRFNRHSVHLAKGKIRVTAIRGVRSLIRVTFGGLLCLAYLFIQIPQNTFLSSYARFKMLEGIDHSRAAQLGLKYSDCNFTDKKKCLQLGKTFCDYLSI